MVEVALLSSCQVKEVGGDRVHHHRLHLHDQKGVDHLALQYLRHQLYCLHYLTEVEYLQVLLLTYVIHSYLVEESPVRRLPLQ